jgi:hypothetical protein
MATLKILVSGSGSRFEVDPAGKIAGGDRFQEFCESLGGALARKGHQIFLLSDYDVHADSATFKGYGEASVATQRDLPPAVVTYGTVSDPENKKGIKFVELRGRFPKLEVRDFNGEGEYPFNRVSIVREVDVVIVVGGEKGAKDMVEIAQALGKTIIPVACFGGVGERTWDRLRADIDRVTNHMTEPLTRYFGDTSDQRSDAIVALVERMATANRRETRVLYPYLLAVELVCVFVWFAVLLTGQSYSQLSIPIILLCMAIFGIVMRSLIRMFGNQDVVITAKIFAIEAGIGTGLSLIYYIFFMLGGSSITDSLKSALATERSFTSIGLIISLLAFGVSFLLEDSILKASKKLSEVNAL